jgi:succinoglycan biosynthesis protein ExoM
MNKEHITVCICTYKRPRLLKKLLENLAVQETENRFEISVSIVDNDADLSAKPVIDIFLKNNKMQLVYAHVPERNLALLRNISVINSKGDYVAFIDDDECPTKYWLLLLYKTLHQFRVSGALGPVLPSYQVEPPEWVKKGKFCERMRYETGRYLVPSQTRTGNALLKRQLFLNPENLFNLRFSLGGEDDTLFEKLIGKGHKFVWCDEAVVYEEIPATRLTVSYFMKRSRLIGFMTYYYFKDTKPLYKNIFVVLRSCAIFIIYIASLPIDLVRGYDHFVDRLVRLNHHKSIILTFLGLLRIEKRDI